MVHNMFRDQVVRPINYNSYGQVLDKATDKKIVLEVNGNLVHLECVAKHTKS